jgi:hypothetical protein
MPLLKQFKTPENSNVSLWLLNEDFENLKAQAEFQRDLGRDFNKSNVTPTEFLLSDRYDRLLQTYEQKLGRILGLSPQQVRSSAPKPAGNYGPAKEKLLRDLEGKK